jgi:lysophospholipid acyltransferase (LPLAT)-like uncharacterized protein
MKLRSPTLIRITAAIAALVIWCWMCTIRIRVASLDGASHPADPAQRRLFYCFWHEGLLAPLRTRIKIQMLISQHADGELITQVCRWLGFDVIRGSTTRGGSEALLAMMRNSDRAAHLGITPDGPKGPRRKLQLGMIFVASETGLPVVPVGIGFTHAWRANSWDRFALPRPFSTICGVVSEPIAIPPGLDRAGLNSWRETVERRLSEVTELAEVWAHETRFRGGHAPAPSGSVKPAPAWRLSA